MLSIKQAKELASEKYLKLASGVVGVGKTNPTPMITIDVTRENVIRDMNIPNNIGGYPVKIRVVEEYYTHYESRRAKRNKTDIYLEQVQSSIQAVSPSDRQKEWRPIVPGISTTYPSGTAGTLGAIVYENGTNRVLILSNHHVLVENQSKGDNDILQPGPADGGDRNNEDHIVGKVYKFVRIDSSSDNENFVDAAVASIVGDVGVIRAILDIGELDPSPVDPKPEMKVQKSGRTTGHTKGTIEDDDKDIFVNDRRFTNKLLYKNVFSIIPPESSAGGDSGSLWCTVPATGSKARPVGLHFAGNNAEGLAIPIKAVINKLGITFSPPDKTPPSVSFITRSGLQYKPGTRFTVRGRASDNEWVRSVDVRVEDSGYFAAKPLGTGDNEWSVWERGFTINTPGDYEMVARATDRTGNRKYATSRVIITNQPKPSEPPGESGSNKLLYAMLGTTIIGAGGAGYYFYKRK